MLADFVVTTIDHVLFAAMQAPHLALRHLGLSRKVVIIDEVHVYSTYMYVYLKRALTWLASYGVPVVLLSATLSEKQTTELVAAYRKGRGTRISSRQKKHILSTPFPCIVSASQESVDITPTPASGRTSTCTVQRLEDGDLVSLLEDSLSEGGCALIVRNTVVRAQETFELLREHFGDDVMLNHARFTIGDRLAKDADLLRRFGPPRSHPNRPYRAIVVATQVVEQSLDVDFDLLITDLAPIDLVLQRMGRLHRHNRPRPPKLVAPVCYIDALPNEGKEPNLDWGGKGIYGARDLLLTAAALLRRIKSSGEITAPDDVHALIEEVYGDHPDIPTAWQTAFAEAQQEEETERKDKENAARTFLLDEPLPAGASPSLTSWLSVMTTDDETAGRAHVRDGEDSLEVILIEEEQIGGQIELRTLSSSPDQPGEIIPIDQMPRDEICRIMAMSSVRLPNSLSRGKKLFDILKEFENNRFYEAWQRSPLLSGQLVLPLTNKRATLLGTILEYTSETGLKEVK